MYDIIDMSTIYHALKNVFPYLGTTESILNNIYKKPFIIRSSQNKNPTAENKRIMSRFTQSPMYQPHTPAHLLTLPNVHQLSEKLFPFSIPLARI